MDYPVEKWLPLIEDGTEESNIRNKIIRQVISHPTEVPTFTEINYMIPSVDEDELEMKLDGLEDIGILQTHSRDDYTFVGFTALGKQFIVDTGLNDIGPVLKQIYKSTSRTDEIEKAYNAERPEFDHFQKQYSKNSTDTPEWERARNKTFRTLKLSVREIEENTFQASLINTENETVLDTEIINVQNQSEELNTPESEIEYMERRGEILDDSEYEVKVEKPTRNSNYTIKPYKNGESWYSSIERGIHIFTEE